MAITVPVTFPVATMSRPMERAGKLHLLVVDEDAAIRSACCEIATDLGFVPQTVSSIAAARTLLRDQGIDILLLDLHAPLGEGLALLNEIKSLNPGLVVVVMTALRDGACGGRGHAHRGRRLSDQAFCPGRTGRRAGAGHRSGAPSTAPAAVCANPCVPPGPGQHDRPQPGDGQALPHPGQGGAELPSGADPGRERGGQRAGGAVHSFQRAPCRPAVCAHRLRFAGAHADGERALRLRERGLHRRQPPKEGLLASAEGGTVFLDEIGELPLDLQAKLLRALQEKEVRPVGATHRVAINVRILAATNRNLTAMVEQGRFRKDLYYRLSVVNLRIPPLRERKQDIPLLAAHFLERMSRETGTTHTLSDDALRTLVEYEWPGNVRELRIRSIAPAPSPPARSYIWAICPPSCRISICRIAVPSPWPPPLWVLPVPARSPVYALGPARESRPS